MKNRLAIYPYDYKMTPLVRYSNMLENYEVTCLISPKGWGYKGKDGNIADKGDKVNLTVETDFESALDNCDSLFVSDTPRASYIEERIEQNILAALLKNKKVISSRNISKDLIDKINNVNKDLIKNLLLLNQNNKFLYNNLKPKMRSLVNIETPVIFVLGTGERTNKFQIQLSIRDNFIDKGYKVCQIGSRSYSDLFGMVSFPDFMFNSEYTEEDKIILFNHFVKQLEINEKPDVIIIGIPGGIMKLNNKLTNNFGITAFEISNAITPDAVVMSMHYEKYLQSDYRDFNNLCKQKFGFEIDFFNLANSTINWEETDSKNNLEFLVFNYMDLDIYTDKIQEFEFNIINSFKKEDSMILSEKLITKLSSYSYVNN